MRSVVITNGKKTILEHKNSKKVVGTTREQKQPVKHDESKQHESGVKHPVPGEFDEKQHKEDTK